jgi:hypothetical protein
MCDGSSLLQGNLKIAKPCKHGSHGAKPVPAVGKLYAVAMYVNLTSGRVYLRVVTTQSRNRTKARCAKEPTTIVPNSYL